MPCLKPCIGRRSRKEDPRRCGAGRGNSCCERQDLKEKSSRFLFYGGAPAPTEFARGMKNRMAAGGSTRASFFRTPRGEMSSVCFISAAAISYERCPPQTSARLAPAYFPHPVVQS